MRADPPVYRRRSRARCHRRPHRPMPSLRGSREGPAHYHGPVADQSEPAIIPLDRRPRRQSSPLARVGFVVFGIGLLGVAVIMVAFATGCARPAAVAEPGRHAGPGRFRHRADRRLPRGARVATGRSGTNGRGRNRSGTNGNCGMSTGHGVRTVHTGGVVQVAQHADDLDRATAFYTETLGLPLIARFGPLVFVDLGGTRLLLEEAAPPAMIYLEVPDLEATISQAAKGRGRGGGGTARHLHRHRPGVRRCLAGGDTGLHPGFRGESGGVGRPPQLSASSMHRRQQVRLQPFREAGQVR